MAAKPDEMLRNNISSCFYLTRPALIGLRTFVSGSEGEKGERGKRGNSDTRPNTDPQTGNISNVCRGAKGVKSPCVREKGEGEGK